ncbi:MAG: metal-dependent hydrolase [Nanoarchaeota archaeon]|nr:metal-dependent hydrolase [Nanoarchaeota archaeon]MBU1027700.1 metal-dependent hydrolase [Nanoarchaeota archaeon]
MDVISHGLWAILLVKGIFNKGKLWLAFLVGILPDVIPFGIPFVQIIFSGSTLGKEQVINAPSYVHILYGLTHSLLIVTIVFLLIYLIKKKIYIWVLAWPLHILIDIPTHSNEFFPTPFLYPISNFTVNGILWTNPYIFFPNWVLLIILFIIVFWKNIKEFVNRIIKDKKLRFLPKKPV